MIPLLLNDPLFTPLALHSQPLHDRRGWPRSCGSCRSWASRGRSAYAWPERRDRLLRLLAVLCVRARACSARCPDLVTTVTGCDDRRASSAGSTSTASARRGGRHRAIVGRRHARADARDVRRPRIRWSPPSRTRGTTSPGLEPVADRRHQDLALARLHRGRSTGRSGARTCCGSSTRGAGSDQRAEIMRRYRDPLRRCSATVRLDPAVRRACSRSADRSGRGRVAERIDLLEVVGP